MTFRVIVKNLSAVIVFLVVLTFAAGGVFLLFPETVSASHVPEDTLLYQTPDGSTSYYKKAGSFPGNGCYSESNVNNAIHQTREETCSSIEGQQSALEWVLGSLGKITAAGAAHAGLIIIKIIVTVLANLLLILSNFLGFVISFLILRMGDFVNGAASTGIREAWTIIRDIANIGIVGGLVATAIGTIIKSQTYNINVTLAKLIIAALLVNFSYFFTGALIDVANVTTIAVYKSTIIQSTCAPGATCTASDLPGAEFVERIFTSFHLPSVAKEGGEVVLEEQSTKIGTILYNILVAIFMLIAGFYLLQVIFLLLVRFVALIFLLITSPAGIAGLALPFIKSYVEQWWKALYTQALFPIVFFLLTGVSLTIAQRLHPAIIEQAAGKGAYVSFAGQVISFAIAFAFLSIALRVARSLSEQATWFKGLYDWTNKNLATRAGRMYQFIPATVFRNTVGRWAYDNSFKYREWAGKHRLDQGGIFRNVPLVKDIVAGADRQFQKGLEGLSKQKVFGHEGYEPIRREREKREILLGEEERKAQQVGRLDGKLVGADRELIRKKNELEKKRADGTLTEDEAKELASIKSQAEMLERYAKEGGAKNVTNQARTAHEEEYKKGIRLKGESDDAYWKRQDTRGALGRQRGEDLTKYFDRLDKETGHYQARTDLEAIFATLPADFIKEEYQKDPKSIIPYATLLPPKEFLAVMKDANVRRDIKDQMRRERHGFYANQVRALDQKVQSGELVRGSDAYNDELSMLFFYAQNRLKDKDEFLDMITATPFEDLRKMETFWKGGSTTGQYLHARPALGTTEQYESYELKDGQLDQQRQWSGMQIVLGREAFADERYDESGNPQGTHWLPAVGGSDKYYAADEARVWAQKKKVEAERFIANNPGLTGPAMDAAKSLLRKADSILKGSAMLGDLDPHAAGISKAEAKRRQNVINKKAAQAMQEFETIRADASLDAKQKQAKIASVIAQQKGADEAIYYAVSGIFDVQGGVTGTTGMVGWRKGKSVHELGNVSKVETVYSPAFAYIGYDFQELSQIAQEGGWDVRFKDAVKEAALVERSDIDIAKFAANDNQLQAFNGWPPVYAIDAINEARRIKYGLDPDDHSRDLPYDPKEFVAQHQQRQRQTPEDTTKKRKK